MRYLRQLCAATLLMLVVTISAFAGEMQTSGITLQLPDRQVSCMPAAGQADTPPTSYVDQATEIALTLIANTISVF